MAAYDLEKPMKAIVFNHTVFDVKGLTTRAEAPGQKLAACFKDDLKIGDVEHKLNLTSREITSTLRKVSREVDNYSGIIIAISSHGDLQEEEDGYDEIIFAKDESYEKQELWKYFETEAWKNKPKLFFIQACRGSDPTPGITFAEETLMTDSVVLPKFYVPKFPNMFIMCATQPGTVSFRWSDDTPFIEALVDVFKERASTWNLLDMATHICHNVALSFEACHSPHPTYFCSKQMPCFESTLTKLFYFPTKDPEQEVFTKEYEISKRLALVLYYDYSMDMAFFENTEKDINLLTTTLTELEFDVKLLKNYNEKPLFQQLNDHSEYEKYDMFLLVFVGYGEKDELCLLDQNIKINKIWQPFLANNCPKLLGKPKIFIFSACAPDDSEEGISGKFDKMVVEMPRLGNVEACEQDCDDGHKSIPTTADMLMLFETASGQVKYKERNRDAPPFLKFLCNELKSGEHEDMFGVARGVTSTIKQIIDEYFADDHDSHRQIPILFSTLRKLVQIPKPTPELEQNSN